jgi:hypothetical protein
MDNPSTWVDLAAALGRDAKDMRVWRKNGAPNDFNLVAWKAWIAANVRGASAKQPGVADDAALPGECDYDPLVKAGKISYEVAKERESVIGTSLRNEAIRVENQKLRGSLVTKDDADRACALVRDSLNQRFDRSVTRALTRLADQVSAELRAEIVKAINAELDAE